MSKIESTEQIVQRFTGYWIPEELSKLGISITAQLLLSTIDSLQQDAPNYCFASNEYLAKMMGLSPSRVSFYITRLKRLGLIEQVSYDGRIRRLRCLKHNWFRPKMEAFSKNNHCVKPRNPTARKREVRLRENAHHITNIYKEDYIKESISDIVETVHNSAPPDDPVPIVPPSASPAEGSILLHSKKQENEVDLNDPILLELLALESEYIKYFRPSTVALWIKKFGAEFVLETMKYFFQVLETQKIPIRKPEPWMEEAFKRRYAKINKTVRNNKEFAKKLRSEYNLHRLKINKRYCSDTVTGRDFYYDLPHEEFKRALTNQQWL